MSSFLFNQYYLNQTVMQDEEFLLESETKQQQPVTKKKINLLYSWGRNEDGQLAVPNAKNIHLPTFSRGVKGYARKVATARSHTALLNHEGEIYMTGSCLFGKMGIPSQVSNFRQFHFQNAMKQHKVVQVACGDYHTLALTDQGKVFSWGGSLWDKTGHKGQGVHQIQKLANEIITQIACGDFHSVVINNKGQIYSWGGGSQNKNKGQLGHSNKKDLPHPELIQFFKGMKVIKIACGDYHTMVMTNDDTLYAFGQGNFGQLGTGGKEDSATPKKVILNCLEGKQQYWRSDITEKTYIKQMALGGHHSLLLTNRGHVYVCGYGSQGQLGLGQGNTDNKYQPTLAKALVQKQVAMIAAGSNHSLALTTNHDIFACGYNARGQLGIGQQRSVTMWTHVTTLAGKNVGRIYAGGDHSWALVDQLQPQIQNYEFPSPLKLTIDQPIRHNQSIIPPPEKSGVSNSSMDQLLNQLKSNRKLQLILTQVQLSHRFIHFIVNDSAKNTKKRIQEYLKFVYENEKKQMKYDKVTEDCDMFDAKGKLLLPANSKGWTIMLVCQIPSTATEYLSYQPHKTPIAIGDLLIMESNMLRQQGRIPIYNRWFFKFNEMFDDILERARFVELRPKIY